MNKRQAQIYGSYIRSNAHYLTDVYSSMSYAKIDAFRRCERLYHDDCVKYDWENLGDMRIISSNSFTFSVAWTVSTDEYQYLHVITPSNNYFFEVACYI